MAIGFCFTVSVSQPSFILTITTRQLNNCSVKGYHNGGHNITCIDNSATVCTPTVPVPRLYKGGG